MERLRPNYRREVTYRVLSESIWRLAVHWSFRYRRTILCPMSDCPVCQSERPKFRGYAIGRFKQAATKSEVGLIEVGEMILRDLARLGYDDLQRAAGITWEQSPGQDGVNRVSRAGVGVIDGEPIFTGAGVASAVEELYQLPPSFEAVGSWEEWVQKQQGTLLAKARRIFTEWETAT